MFNHEVKYRILILNVASMYKTVQIIKNVSRAQILVTKFQFATYSVLLNPDILVFLCWGWKSSSDPKKIPNQWLNTTVCTVTTEGSSLLSLTPSSQSLSPLWWNHLPFKSYHLSSKGLSIAFFLTLVSNKPTFSWPFSICCFVQK